MLYVFAFLRSALGASSTPAEKRFKWIHTAPAPTSTRLNSLFAMLVIDFSFVFVAENFVSIGDLLELGWITTLVRMLFQCFLSICLLDLVKRGILLNSKKIIILAIINILLGATGTRMSAMHALKLFEWESATKHYSFCFLLGYLK